MDSSLSPVLPLRGSSAISPRESFCLEIELRRPSPWLSTSSPLVSEEDADVLVTALLDPIAKHLLRERRAAGRHGKQQSLRDNFPTNHTVQAYDR
ncbi:hypothetical protein CaCOL14_013090 [Colletotrichum acutatum]